MTTVNKILEERAASTEEALNYFDSLAPATIAQIIGRWKGFEIKTGHPLDGLLVPSGWYGKMFVSTEEVHPLLFFTDNKTELYAVNPKHIPLEMNFPKSNSLGILMGMAKPVLQTQKSKARLRMIEYRGKLTATMVYDEKSIFDHFAMIDENTLLGCMDLKNVPQPYFFVLERDDATSYKLDFNH